MCDSSPLSSLRCVYTACYLVYLFTEQSDTKDIMSVASDFTCTTWKSTNTQNTASFYFWQQYQEASTMQNRKFPPFPPFPPLPNSRFTSTEAHGWECERQHDTVTFNTFPRFPSHVVPNVVQLCLKIHYWFSAVTARDECCPREELGDAQVLESSTLCLMRKNWSHLFLILLMCCCTSKSKWLCLCVWRGISRPPRLQRRSIYNILFQPRVCEQENNICIYNYTFISN